MAGIDAALHRLQPVGVLQPLRCIGLFRRHRRELEFWQPRLVLRLSHIGPQHAAALDQRIGAQLDHRAEPTLLRLRRNLHALPGHVVFPAMVRTAQPALLIATEPQRHAAMRAELIDQSVTAFGVAKCNQPLRQKLHAHRRTVVLRQFLGQQGWYPIPTEHLAHRCPHARAGQQVILFLAKHGCLLHESAQYIPVVTYLSSHTCRR